MNKKSVIIYSGGMDSTVLLYNFKEQIKLAISFNYGSKHNDREFEFAKYHTNLLNIEHIRISLDFIAEHFKSDLLKSGGEIPEGHYEDKSMERTVVPFRNGIMLSIVTGLAESKDLDSILIGNHFGDDAIYPDCRSNFINPMKLAIRNGTYKNIELLSPYVNITKRDIALIGKELNIDFSKTWSCYKGKDIHCSVCGTCVERREALLGFDNTIYKKEI